MNKEKLTFYDMFYIFLFGCFFGWIVEGIWTLIKKQTIINHSALVLGPFNIIYGIGAIVLTLMLHKMNKDDVIKIYIMSFITGSLLEYIISFLSEHFVGFTAWSYRSKFMNINGRICLQYSIFWGFLGIIWSLYVYPLVQKIINKIDYQKGTSFMRFMIVFIVFDVFLTLAAIDRGKAFEENIPPSNKFEEVIDEYFGVNYLNNMFNNRWNRK